MRTRALFSAVFLFTLAICTAAQAKESLRLAIMPAEDPRREASKHANLGLYIHVHSTQLEDVQLRVAKDYREAVDQFLSGKVDGIFAGSFAAAMLIKKGLAKPVARPVLNSGATTYRALVVAKAGTKPFEGVADLRGKRVSFCALASAGEVYVRSLLGPGEKLEGALTPVYSPTHAAALDALKDGKADYAVVKNLLWDAEKYGGLAVVGEDKGENPNYALVLGNAAFEKYGEELGRILLRIGNDSSIGAQELRKAMSAKGFVATGVADFVHTFGLIEKARIDPAKFDFAF